MSEGGHPAHPDVEIAQVETGFERFLRLEMFRFRQRLFGGGWSRWRGYDVLRRGPAVAVALYDPERDLVVLVEQLRLPALLAGAPPWQIEVPAGLVDADESPEAVALREIREETGLVPTGALIPIRRYLPSPGDSDQIVHLYCAPVDATQAAGLHGLAEEGEDIRVVVKTFAEVEVLIDDGTIENGHSLIALAWLRHHRAELRRNWRSPPVR